MGPGADICESSARAAVRPADAGPTACTEADTGPEVANLDADATSDVSTGSDVGAVTGAGSETGGSDDIRGIEVFPEVGYPADSQLIPEISGGYPESGF